MSVWYQIGEAPVERIDPSSIAQRSAEWAVLVRSASGIGRAQGRIVQAVSE